MGEELARLFVLSNERLKSLPARETFRVGAPLLELGQESQAGVLGDLVEQSAAANAQLGINVLQADSQCGGGGDAEFSQASFGLFAISKTLVAKPLDYLGDVLFVLGRGNRLPVIGRLSRRLLGKGDKIRGRLRDDHVAQVGEIA